LLSFVWLSYFHTKFLIKLANSSNDWLHLLWFYTTLSSSFYRRRVRNFIVCNFGSLKEVLVKSSCNNSNLILIYFKRCPHHQSPIHCWKIKLKKKIILFFLGTNLILARWTPRPNFTWHKSFFFLFLTVFGDLNMRCYLLIKERIACDHFFKQVAKRCDAE